MLHSTFATSCWCCSPWLASTSFVNACRSGKPYCHLLIMRCRQEISCCTQSRLLMGILRYVVHMQHRCSCLHANKDTAIVFVLPKACRADACAYRPADTGVASLEAAQTESCWSMSAAASAEPGKFDTAAWAPWLGLQNTCAADEQHCSVDQLDQKAKSCASQ